MTNVTLDDDTMMRVIENIMGLISLLPDKSCRFLGSLPNFFNKFIQPIKHTIDDASLLLRLRLISLLFLYCTPREIKLKNPDEFMNILLSLLDNHQEDIFDLINSILLLVNSLDLSKKLLLGKCIGHKYCHELAENVPLVVNKGGVLESPKVELAAVNFVEQVFRANKGDFFFTNDIFVLIDILTRLIKDHNKSSPLMDYIRCYETLILWPQYPNHKYKPDMIRETLQELLSNAQNEFPQTPLSQAVADTAEGLLLKFKRANPV